MSLNSFKNLIKNVYKSYIWYICVLYIDLQPGQTCHSKVMHRKEGTHSDGSYEKKSRRRAWLTKWNKVKSHGTLIDWCSGREWPVNCMIVISAWWRRNMPFQRLNGRLNYYITRCRQEVRELERRWVGVKSDRESHYPAEGSLGTPVSWRSDELETRCDRESHHPAEGTLGTHDWVWRSDQLVRRCWNENMSQRGCAHRPPVEQPRRTRMTHGDIWRGWGGQYVAVFVRSPTPSHTHQPFK